MPIFKKLKNPTLCSRLKNAPQNFDFFRTRTYPVREILLFIKFFLEKAIRCESNDGKNRQKLTKIVKIITVYKIIMPL
jgi:hypothetical protein